MLAPALLAASLSATAWAAGGELMSCEQDGEIVFSNTPCTGGKPIAGIAAPLGSPRGRTTELPSTPYDPFIEQVARENGLSPSLVKAVALVESGFNPRAESPKGARGLMQLMPGTARRLGVKDAFDPLENLAAGARYLRELLEQFDGDVSLALAAYNAGPERVRKSGGVPAIRETQHYVRKVHERMGSRPSASASRPIAATQEIKLVRLADGSVALLN
ncbi:MAG TPA: lytic transglycosylase domain-containing protein [Candidatus Polarisedimenticolaceae bacterium]|nr:lytic transglycosylase domain-containing protein [Candidatus Polarisedimenticolaceae bacterium]